jgi:uncharacterized protein
MKQNKLLFTIAFIIAFFAINFAQTPTEKRIIEVTGSAETLVTPNEFTFKITLLERIENKQKITIEMQETKLKNELANLGVDVAKDLTIYDLNSFYVYQKKLKDTLASKDYQLKIKDLAKIEKLQEIADKLNVSRLDLIESTHSELTSYRKETKMEAVKAAKAKAQYMLEAIGENVGKPVFIQEVDESSPRQFSSPNGLISNVSNSVIGLTTGIFGSAQNSDGTLSFSKLKLRYVVLARFEIQ